MSKIAGLSLLIPLVTVAMAPPVWGQTQPNYNSSQAVSSRPSPPADPQSRARVHTELAALYFQAGNLAVSLEELRLAIDLDARYAPAYSVKGLVHANLGENEQAESQFKKALDLAPQDPEINNNYGWFLCQTGRERQSIAYFLNALKSPLYSTPDLAYANAGGCALKAGDLEGAENYLYQAIRFSRDGGLVPRTQMANLFYRRGKLDEARNLINGVLKDSDAPTAEALWLALRIARKMGNRETEGALAVQLRGRHPASQEYQDFLKGRFE